VTGFLRRPRGDVAHSSRRVSRPAQQRWQRRRIRRGTASFMLYRERPGTGGRSAQPRLSGYLASRSCR
jgi:hypothetical protein